MKKYFNRFILFGIIFLVLFNILTVLLAFVDKQMVGINEVGLATINQFFLVKKYNKMWDVLTDVILYVSAGFVFGMGIYGLKQVVERKSLFKVDKDILAFGVGIGIILIVWVVFDFLWVVNVRPIDVSGTEASFPSTHIMFSTFTLLESCAIITKRNSNNKKYCFAGYVGISTLLCISFVGRILSKMHWMTDALGGLFLGLAMFLLVYGISKFFAEKNVCKA